MLSSLLAVSLQLGPFYAQRQNDFAVRPLFAREAGVTDVLWPLFTARDDWWRLAFLAYSQRGGDGIGDQFAVLPCWFSGHDREGEAFAGFFPVAGYHPHLLGLYDLHYALWPLWHSYRMPRVHPDGRREWLATRSVLFPIASWRSDGTWSVWPLYGVNYQRESDHRYALWPLVTWASYRDDRDTAGEGYSWSVLPFYSRVRRRYEEQDSFLPPFFSVAATWGKRLPAAGELVHSGPESLRVRFPWPFFEYESTPVRVRFALWPFYESDVHYEYLASRTKGKCRETESSHVTRFGWKLVELYDDETRVFPFWVSSRDYLRVWPLFETVRRGDASETRALALLPIRHAPAVERNWAPFWTFYRFFTAPIYRDHELFWGLIKWRTWR